MVGITSSKLSHNAFGKSETCRSQWGSYEVNRVQVSRRLGVTLIVLTLRRQEGLSVLVHREE